MSYAVQFHDGPDRDAYFERDTEPPATVKGELVVRRRWDTERWIETVRRYTYVRANLGGQSGVTHYEFAGWTE